MQPNESFLGVRNPQLRLNLQPGPMERARAPVQKPMGSLWRSWGPLCPRTTGPAWPDAPVSKNPDYVYGYTFDRVTIGAWSRSDTEPSASS